MNGEKGERGRTNPEQLVCLMEGYIEAIAKHEMPGQDNPAAQAACVFEEQDKAEGPNRHYWIDYQFTTQYGEGISLRFQQAGHIPANNITWSSDQGQVHFYQHRESLLLIYADHGSVWFDVHPEAHEAYVSARDPARPNWNVTVYGKRASQGWLEKYTQFDEQEHRAGVEARVAAAMEQYEAGQTLPPTPCEGWLDAEGQLNRLMAQHLPEQLMHYFSELSRAMALCHLPPGQRHSLLAILKNSKIRHKCLLPCF